MSENRTVVVASRGALAAAFLHWQMDLEGSPEETAPRGSEESIEEFSLRQADCLLSYLADAADDGSALVCFPRAEGITTAGAVAEVGQAAAQAADPAEAFAQAEAASAQRVQAAIGQPAPEMQTLANDRQADAVVQRVKAAVSPETA